MNIDLYCVLQQQKDWLVDDLVRQAQIKFDHFLDPLQLAAQFVKSQELKDYPKMITKIDEKEWQSFFMSEAKRISGGQVS